MQYFSGLFDAEGYVSLMKSGHFTIGLEMTCESIPNIFQETFGGKIYVRKRDKRKKTWTWVIATNTNLAVNFVESIAKFCVIKQTQLLRIKDYLQSTRTFRKEIRDPVSSQLADLKIPFNLTKEHINVCQTIIPDEHFFQWLAGFMDGDGNLCIYECKSPKNTPIFDSWISIFNTHPIAIKYVQDRIKGSISKYKGTKFPIWKWVCCQKDSILLCDSLYPFLRIKKEQCFLVSEFLQIQKTKIREKSYSFEQINRIREIITQIKHLNSL